MSTATLERSRTPEDDRVIDGSVRIGLGQIGSQNAIEEVAKVDESEYGTSNSTTAEAPRSIQEAKRPNNVLVALLKKEVLALEQELTENEESPIRQRLIKTMKVSDEGIRPTTADSVRMALIEIAKKNPQLEHEISVILGEVGFSLDD